MIKDAFPKNALEENRFGRIFISSETFRNDFSAVAAIYRILVPVKIEHDFSFDGFFCTGYSDDFEPVPQGLLPNAYDFKIKASRLPGHIHYGVVFIKQSASK